MTTWIETHPKPTEDQFLIKELRELIKHQEALITAQIAKINALEIEIAQLKRCLQSD